MKKQLFKVLVVASIFSMNAALFSQAIAIESAITPLVDNSGEERIVHIVSQIKHNVVPDQAEPIVYAQVANIDQDLNIKEIVNFLEPQTIMGKAFLQETLRHPVSPIDQSGVVGLRQDMIMQLVENPEFKQQVEEILVIAAEQEQDMKMLMSNTFRSRVCPEFEQLEMIKKQNPGLYPVIKALHADQITKNVLIAMNALGLYLNGKNTIMYGNFTLDAIKNNQPFASKAGLTVFLAFMAGLPAYAFYDDYTKASEKRSKMHALNQLIYVAESIEQLSNQYKIANQFKISLITDDEGVYLIERLKAWRYQNEVDYLFYTTGVHTLLFEIYQNDSRLAQIFASIAEMDAYNAIATKILASRNNQQKFCFAQKINASKPVVVSTGFWNVLVKNPVINSMPLSKNAILTGPNAGGKTTSIRAILQNIVLAQTYGVAAADKFEYTQFDTILSYLNISDDLMNGYSLFASEIKRAKELLEILRALTPDQKLFFALDELFTGTAAEQGEKCAYAFIKKTAEFDQSLFIYATHFDKLKELGYQDTRLMNYKVDAPTKNDAGKLVYPFTLSAGASTVNIAEDMAKEAGLFD